MKRIATLTLPLELLARILRGEATPAPPPMLPRDLRITAARQRGRSLELRARGDWGAEGAPELTAVVCEGNPRAPKRVKPARVAGMPSDEVRASRPTKSVGAEAGAASVLTRHGTRDGASEREGEPVNPGQPAPPAHKEAANAQRGMADGGGKAARGGSGADPQRPIRPRREAGRGDPEGAVPGPAPAATPAVTVHKPSAVGTSESPGARIVAVRQVPQGVSGRDLTLPKVEALVPGSLWRRGQQTVRVIAVLKSDRKRIGPPLSSVEFRELTFGSALRRLPMPSFLESSIPVREEAAAASPAAE